MEIIDYKLVLANLLTIESKILSAYDFDEEKAKEHIGYNEIEVLATKITEIIKADEDKEIIDNSFIL